MHVNHSSLVMRNNDNVVGCGLRGGEIDEICVLASMTSSSIATT
jgi:hypothetical protein